MNKAEILIIDDEPQIRKLLQINLESNDYKVVQASTGKEGLILSASHPPDLILLDIGLPDKSGHEILQELREWYNKPIIILSVQARIRSAIRRSQNTENNSIITCGDIEIDLVARIVKRNNEALKLTSTEYNLLALFAKNEGKVLTHQYLLKEIWGYSYQTETQYLRVFVGTLRKKIEENSNNPQHIVTESGVGYRFQ